MPVEEAEALNAIGFTKDVYLGPENYVFEENGGGVTRSDYEEQLDNSDLPAGYGEALDAMFAAYDHSEDHAKEDPHTGGAVSSPDCTLQANGTKTDMHVTGMPTINC